MILKLPFFLSFLRCGLLFLLLSELLCSAIVCFKDANLLDSFPYPGYSSRYRIPRLLHYSAVARYFGRRSLLPRGSLGKRTPCWGCLFSWLLNVQATGTVYLTKRHSVSHQQVQCISSTGTVYLTNTHSVSHQHAQCISPTCTVYLINTHSVSHQHAQCISPTGTVYLTNRDSVSHQQGQCISPTGTVYLTNRHSVSHQQGQCISPTGTVYLTNRHSVSHQQAQCISPTGTVYLTNRDSVSHQQAQCISGTGLRGQFDAMPYRDKICRSRCLPHPVTAH